MDMTVMTDMGHGCHSHGSCDKVGQAAPEEYLNSPWAKDEISTVRKVLIACKAGVQMKDMKAYNFATSL